MAFWRHSAFKLTILAMGAMQQYDCDPMAEPATRLEKCIYRAVKQLWPGFYQPTATPSSSMSR